MRIESRYALYRIAITALLVACAASIGIENTSAEGEPKVKDATISGHNVTVGRHNGRTSIMIDGKPIPGVAILAPARGKGDDAPSSLTGSVEAGIKIVFVTIGGDWSGPGKYDFSGALRHLEVVQDRAPDTWMVMRICIDAPYWWLVANPDECARSADSTGPERYASMGSEKWIKDSSEYLAAFVRAVEGAPLGRKIIGYSLLTSHGGEWIYTGAGAGKIGDYSEPALKYYRAWLKKKYGDKDWIAKVQIPSEEDRGRAWPALLRDPKRDARSIDFDLAFSDMTADNLLAWCRAVKKESHRRRLVGAFYGYLLWQTGLVNSAATNGHLALRRLLESPDIDFVTSFPSYDVREPGAAAPILSPVESVQAAGKLLFDECDDRTHLVGGPPAIRFQMVRDQRDPANGPQQWSGMWNIWGVETEQIALAVLRREFAHHLIRGSAFWWFDMTGGWYSSPEIFAEFGKEVKIASQAVDWDMSSSSEVTGIVSGESPAYHSMTRMYDIDPQPALVDLQADMSTREMYKAGTPVDWWMQEDLARPEMKQYKAIYFHNPTFIDDKQQKALEKLKSDGRVMIFVGYPGLAADGKLDDKAASKITGIKLKLVNTRSAARFQVKDYNLPCMQEAASQIVFGSGAVISPRLIIDDPDAQVIATWPDGEPAAAMKKHDGWTAYYFPVPPNNAYLFRGIFKNAGCHIYTHNTCRDVVYANKSLLAIHSNHYGQLVVLPRPARVTDLYTGHVLVEKGTRINLGRSWQWGGGTYLFRVEYE